MNNEEEIEESDSKPVKHKTGPVKLNDHVLMIFKKQLHAAKRPG